MKEFFDNLKRSLIDVNIKNGDMVYVASDVTALMYEANKLYGVKSRTDRDKFLNEFINTFLINIKCSLQSILTNKIQIIK